MADTARSPCLSPSLLTSDDNVQLSTCRRCSNRFSYKPSSSEAVEIIIGRPPGGLKYKAISHVWGSQFVVDMHCQSCSNIHPIRVRSKTTFENIIALAGPSSTIWIDSMSINQNDHSDVAAQVAVMGDIYGNAQCVSVLLPPSDMEAYESISELFSMAKLLLERKGQFDYNPEHEELEAGELEGIKETGKIAKRFFELAEDFQSKLSQYKYWTRAWTFQEWARAYDVEVAFDGPQNPFPVLQKVKSTIVYAGIMIADYKLRKGQYALMDLGWSRGFAKPHLDGIKRLFPFEDVFASPDEISAFEMRFQIAFPNEGTNAILGLRDVPRNIRTSDEQFRARLSLMLDSFAGMNAREATYEADLVCCWASMCSISYDYSKEDSLAVATVKIVRALRQRGITIFNFTASSHQEQDIDLAFFAYAAAHRQSNATNQAIFPGSPIFSAHADTLKHFQTVLKGYDTQPGTLPHAASGTVAVQAVFGAAILTVVPLSNRLAVIATLKRVFSGGEADNMMFTDQLSLILTQLNLIRESYLEHFTLVIAAIPKGLEPGAGQYFYAWGICPKSVIQDVGALYIGREELNGTLVVAKDRTLPIVAYLVISDQRSGTFLIPVSQTGQVEILVQTPTRSDVGNREVTRDRKLSAQLQLVNPSAIIADCGGPKMLWNSTRALRAFINSGSEITNDAVITPSEQYIEVELLRELVQRKFETLPADRRFDRGWPGLGSTALKIDIGHPDLIPEELDAVNFNRIIARKRQRRSSL